MDNLTFLDYEQIDGPNKLDIFKIYGTKCAITDFSILLGGFVTSIYHTSEGNSRENRTGWWWTKTPYHQNARVVDSYGDRYWTMFTDTIVGLVQLYLTHQSLQSPRTE